MTDSVAADSLVQRLPTDATAVHRANLVSDVVINYVVDSSTVESAEIDTWRPTASRSHFK